MKRVCLGLLIGLALPATGAANEYCQYVAALGRINTATAGVVEAETDDVIRTNIRSLQAELRFNNLQDLSKQLDGRFSEEDIDILTQQLLLSAAINFAASTNNSVLFQTYANDQDNAALINRSKQILRKQQCIPATLTLDAPLSSQAGTEQGSDSNGAGQLGRLTQFPIRAVSTTTLIAVLLLSLIPAAKYSWKAWRRHQRRLVKRYVVDLKVKFSMGAINYNGLLADISLSGLRINHKGILAAHTANKIKVLILDDWHVGHITWRNETFCGVALQINFTKTAIAHIRAVDRAARKNKAKPVTAGQNIQHGNDHIPNPTK